MKKLMMMKQLLRMLTLIQVRMLIMIISKQMTVTLMQVRMLIKQMVTLIKNMSGLNPSNGFSKFDPSKILTFAKMYPDDFTTQEIGSLLGDIESFCHTISDDDNFEDLNGISDLARVIVETGTHSSCPTVYQVVKLALILPVATATIERCFSKLKLVKTDLRNRIGPEFLNNAMVCVVEKDFLVK
ncbi:putative HAT dimerization domain, ribonuclease H-like superfamily [Helianthus annuus]|uniref:HAT dimerization domain, ribonuclease H-like superfamily n=1 Tax=Helianthus annuus TaxID=4232 RepID=A0A9K3GSG7_HELAN|nr:putative HAT dimerization domain, ribonuclease H-like superfamily [Helianthus annuus]KAJ0431526.1 putative HAT dimerization domain, ribonuclease H-like superfamily [Helianthus annuus]KAJ0445975.1 putative HAT dimerization domain, ribonuclease H-like superfamily [Helianthus annuus]